MTDLVNYQNKRVVVQAAVFRNGEARPGCC